MGVLPARGRPNVDLHDRDVRYASCRFLERELYVFHDEVRFCCVGKRGGLTPPRIPMKTDVPLDMEVVERERRRVREANNGPAPPCAGCPHLERDFWNRTRGSHAVQTLGVANGLRCNLACDYCSQVRSPARAGALGATARGFGRLLGRMLDDGWLSPTGRVTLSGGEPTLMPDFESTLRALLDRGLRVSVLSNATVFSPVLGELLAAGRNVRVLTSVDCGTPELYRRMKGKNLFFRVLDNLGAYARTGGVVAAKYIVCRDNTDQREFEEFADHLRLEGIRRAAVSVDTDPTVELPPNGPHAPGAAMERLRQALRRRGIDVRVMDFGLKLRGAAGLRGVRVRDRVASWLGA
jgi:pyruvate-formate lyase-activating enzyme